MEDEISDEEIANGVLDVLANGSGFVRVDAAGQSREDVYVSPAQIRRCELRAGDDWYRAGESRGRYLDEFDVVWMRKDPPFDMRYIYATHLLSLVRKPTLVVNDPQTLRDNNEKLVTLRFPDLIPESLISSRISELLAFRERRAPDFRKLGG